MDQARIKQAFSDLREARTGLHAAVEQEITAKVQLEQAKALELAGGEKINGKNAETREAQLREVCKAEFNTVEVARRRKAQAQLQFDLAQIECNEIQWLIRAQMETI